jgi:BASS family bile acid:Na+ symporter
MNVLRGVSWFSRRFFVFIVILASLLGYLQPRGFHWVGTELDAGVLGTVNGVVIGLGVIMLGMGMTLRLDEISVAFRHPERIGLGVLFQFVMMPLLALVIVLTMDLPTSAGLGVILLGCCPGGTASNVMTYLAGADVPLSIAVTVTGTLLAIVATPWLFWLYGGQVMGVYLEKPIDVPVDLLTRTIAIVVVPILLGLIIKISFNLSEREERLDQFFSLLSIIVIGLIVGYVVSSVEPELLERELTGLSVPVFLHNGMGLAAGFLAGGFFGMPRNTVRALSLEVGMQNSGLALALAGVLQTQLSSTDLFTKSELALLGVPAVLFSVWHNVTGPLLASVWSRTS